jgi:hypothetical protein
MVKLFKIPAGMRFKKDRIHLYFHVTKKGYIDYKKGKGVLPRDVKFEQWGKGTKYKPKW